MLRRILSLSLILALAASSQAATRWLTEREGAPVRWQAWSDAAIARAKKGNRPIFLAIGYASSYECYRMHREAFLNGEIAEHLNAYFVPIVLDPIEHPEIAEAYETVLDAMGVAPACPSILMLTPDLGPFAGGGALRPDELDRMLVINANRWANERDAVFRDASANLEKARALGEKRMPSAIDPTTIESVVEAIATRHATEKTLDPNSIPFLFRYAARTKNENLRDLTRTALLQLATRPARDQLGGGFHRGDESLEKMLPDQAMLAAAYLEAWQITRDPELAHIARTTVDYVLRDLRFPARAAFEASQDAHSLVPGQGPVFVNGAFYRWSVDEIDSLLGHETAGKVARLFGLKEGETDRPVLSEVRGLHEARDELAAPLAKMLEVRQKRPAPFREPAVVAGWNGLMISALARAGAVLNEPRYVEAANAAAIEVTTKLWKPATKTLSRTTDGVEALAEDYAMLVQGLLDLFESGRDPKWLELAIALQQREDALFWDASAGRYATGATLPVVLRGLLVERDGETPSANAITAVNLLRLAALTGNESWRARPAMIFQSFGGRLRSFGEQLPHVAAAYEMSLVAPRIVVITGDLRKPETQELLRAEHERWEPMRAIVFLPPKGASRERVVKVLPWTAALAPDPEGPVAYVCATGECRR